LHLVSHSWTSVSSFNCDSVLANKHVITITDTYDTNMKDKTAYSYIIIQHHTKNKQ